VKYLLDTNACIGWLRNNQPNLVARIQSKQPSEIVICSIVVGELQFGIERADPTHRPNTELRVQQLRQHFISLFYDDGAAQEYGRIRAQLAIQGALIGGHDMQIAAIALTNGLILVTHNTAEFARIKQLSIEDWQLP
jgi:tRNA(fMet)-specific endonuclease VapC